MIETLLPPTLVGRYQALRSETSLLGARLAGGPIGNALTGTPRPSSGSPSSEQALVSAVEAQAYQIAAKLSSGPYSTRMLRSMGHPYSKRHPSPPLPPYMINFQTGRFAMSWRIKARLVGTRIEVEITNTAPYAQRLLHGDRRMIERPYEQRLRDELKTAIPRLVQQWMSGR